MLCTARVVSTVRSFKREVEARGRSTELRLLAGAGVRVSVHLLSLRYSEEDKETVWGVGVQHPDILLVLPYHGRWGHQAVVDKTKRKIFWF